MLYKRLIINGQEFLLAVNQAGAGAPTAATPGDVGVLYMDEDTGVLYKCRAADRVNGVYTWEPVKEGAGYVKTVNGNAPDENGNVEITIPDSGQNPTEGTGLSETASNALITLLKNATYVSGNMYAELKKLADELGVELTDYIPATGITLSESTLSFTTEDTQTITAILTPENASDPVIWSSSDESVATVAGGVVTPVASGDCTITATAGNVSAKCNVNVKLLGAPKYHLLDLTRTFTADTEYFTTTSNNHLKIVTEGAAVYGIANADTYTDGSNKAAGKGANPTTEWFTIPAGATCEFYVLNGTGSGAITTATNSVIRLVAPNGGDWAGKTVAGLELTTAAFITGSKFTVTVSEDTAIGGLTGVFYSTGTIEGDVCFYVNGVRYL